MGSLLDPTIFEFYMSHIENKTFKSIIIKPIIFVRYVDDIFIETHFYNEINKLKQTLYKHLPLNSTLIKKSLSLV